MSSPVKAITALPGGMRGTAALNGRRLINAARMAGGLDRPAVGCTPYDVVWRQDRASLRRYRAGADPGRPAVLLIPSLINRSHVWDLRPGDSFVEGLLGRGYDVFLADWGVPDQRDADNSIATYVDGYMPAIYGAALEQGGQTPAVVGHCFGGVLALLWAASQGDQPPALVSVATPTNWLEMGPLAAITRQGRIEPEDVLDATGNVPPRTLLRAFQMIRPLGDLAGYVTLWDRLHDRPTAQAIRALSDWAHGHVPFPGAAFRELIRDLSRGNALYHGEVVLGGRARRLRDVSAPFLNLYGAHDHVSPPESVAPLTELVGSEDREGFQLRAGHVGLLVGGTARKATLPTLHDWLQPRLAQAAPSPRVAVKPLAVAGEQAGA
jgi:polyhydroxyalkanoate synthase subunit PhaC